MNSFNDDLAHIIGSGVPYRELLLVLFVGAFTTYCVTSLIRPVAIYCGAVAVPRARDVHSLPTARWGGIAIYCGALASVMVAAQLPALTRGFQFSSEVVSMLVAGLVITIVGAIDDRWGIDAFTKLLGQITAGCILVVLGVSWNVAYIPGVGTVILGDEQAGILTVVICVALMNAINFLDGLDGLVTGLAIISAGAIAFFSLTLLAEQGGDVSYYPPALISMMLIGVCLGFLPHNFYRARIFMGDSGALFIGLVLATATISASGKVARASYGIADIPHLLSPLLVAAAVMAVPMIDLISVVSRRIYKRQKIFMADKLHLHHRLLELGHSHRRAVLLVYLWVSVIVISVETLTMVRWWWEIIIILSGVGVALWATFYNFKHYDDHSQAMKD